MRGKFITFEGPDGAGKTTQIRFVEKWLKDCGYDVVLTREPGGSKRGEQIRNMILFATEEEGPLHHTTEILLFHAARADHVHNVILPALEAGKIVLCDRFADSSYAYQGAGRGRATDVEELERFTLRGFEPDYTLFFDLTLQESMKRLLGRLEEQNAFDAETRDFKRAVYDGYKKRFHQNQHRMVRIDAMKDVAAVSDEVRQWVFDVLVPSLDEVGIVPAVSNSQ